jgi:hypothetical protein
MRPKSFFVNGGAGRVICSIPAFEKYQEDHPDEDFVIVCEGGSDFFRGHPTLYSRVYDHWHKNLFEDKLKDTDIVTPEPYRVWEYYNQKCNLPQAFDIAINNKGIRELPDPTIKLTRDEVVKGMMIVSEVRQKTNKKKTVVFQPFGRGIQSQGNLIFDSSGRSFEYYNAISIVKRLQKKYSVIWFSEVPLNPEEAGLKDTVSVPASQGVDLRSWAGIVKEADIFLGCDSVGQHLAKSFDTPAVVVVGSTFAENISYPDYEKFDLLDMGEGQRVYDPIRITMDDESYRSNDGIMAMNDKVEEVIIKSVDKLMNKWYRKPAQEVILPEEFGCGDQGCDTPQQSAPDQKKEKPNIFQVTQDAIASKPPGFSNSVNIAK